MKNKIMLRFRFVLEMKDQRQGKINKIELLKK